MNENGHSLLEWIIDYIRGQDSAGLGGLTASRLALMLTMSRASLYRLFYDEHQMSPASFLKYFKLYRASLLLTENKQMTVKTISQALGFNSSDHFSTVFKTHFGLTPTHFRAIERRKEGEKIEGKKERR
jgi:AraC-like DNA-binding protein